MTHHLLRAIALGSFTASALLAGTSTSEALWRAYVASPDTHPNIPNCSYAGYHASEKPLPQPAVTVNVRDLGAKGDGHSDDLDAFRQAIAKAGEHFAKTGEHGVVLIPEGTYRLDGLLHIHQDGVVLRGEGTDRTVLAFTKSLEQAVVRFTSQGKSVWSWSGGLIWVGPDDTFTRDGSRMARPIGNWERWHGGEHVGDVVGRDGRGDHELQLDAPPSQAIEPGSMVLLHWKDDEQLSLAKTMAGHPLMAQFDWHRSHFARRATFVWPVRVDRLEGNKLILAQPLRVPIEPKWQVKVTTTGKAVREVGIEHLSIRNPEYRVMPHLKNPGYNGIYLNRAHDCWVRDVRMTNVETGFGLAATKHITATGLRIDGLPNHHATACRAGSHDNLVEHFVIESRPHHGLNTEGLSSGNVWRKGTMKHGTFDSHRGMSFAMLRTDITLSNRDGSPGGSGTAGPFLGARCVHWNVRITGGRADWVYQPDCISMGALVGIQGVQPSAKHAWAMVPGDKGCIIADHGQVPDPADLFEAQLELRLKQKQ